MPRMRSALTPPQSNLVEKVRKLLAPPSFFPFTSFSFSLLFPVEAPLPIARLFSILQNLCCNKTVQNYLRFQENNVVSYNLVAETVRSLLWFHGKPDYREVSLSIADALAAMVDVNPENQAVVADLPITDFVNYSLRSYSSPELAEKGIKILRAMLQETTEQAVSLSQIVMEKVDFVKLDMHPALNFNLGPNDLTTAFFRLLVRLEELIPNVKNPVLNRFIFENPKLYETFKHRTKSVEVMYAGNVVKSYFDVPLETEATLLPHDRQQAVTACAFSAPKERQLLFFDHEVPTLLANMKFVKSRQLGLGKYSTLINQGVSLILVALTALINILMLVTWQGMTDDSDPNPLVPSWYKPTLIALGVLHCVFSTVMLAVGVASQRLWINYRTLFFVVFWVMSVFGVAYSYAPPFP